MSLMEGRHGSTSKKEDHDWSKGVASCQYEINTSVLEGVNNRIKQIKRRAYGFHDDYYFYLKVKAAFPGLPR